MYGAVDLGGRSGKVYAWSKDRRSKRDTEAVYTLQTHDDISKLMFRLRHDNFTQVSLISCGFYNTTYQVRFELSSNGQQRIKTNTTLLEPIVAKDYMATLKKPGKFENFSGDDKIKSTYVNFLHAFGTNLAGGVYWNRGGNQYGATSTIALLNRSPRMRAMFSRALNSTNFPEFQDQLQSSFRNITISARYGSRDDDFGNPGFGFSEKISNTTTEAFVSFAQNQFVYHPRDLMIAYGLSIIATAACVGLGIHSMLKTKASFPNNFSTIFRFVKSSQVDHDWEKDVRDGADPLPKNIGEIELRYGKRAMEV
ncbi:hypothetical protein K469DRAFT_208352 [Zopfia rhizophila CBS 207.26]|uniref:Uncharacterized protein n=1 Tax=Zopfia rhizophila CBS 207.26 TaxID=1314779 RepID=A0A6A6DUY0_9PEZI|nr:hypothetical protein K469DRAFT_208352 [Zopfia rhizophila CBS 207.26]